MKRNRIISLLCALMLLLTAACGGEITPASYKEGAVFNVASAQRPDTLNPYTSEGGLAEELFLLCYDPLWRIGADGTAEACLAEDYSLSSDRLTWTIRLRHDVTFSDGIGMTAADVLYSYELMRRSPLYAGYYDGITAIRTPDEYTVVISTEYVKADMQYNPTPILPRHIWRDQDEAAFENPDMIGTGPFIYCPGESGEDGVMLRAREEHFGQEAKLGAVFFAFYGTVTGAARALAAGETDACFGLTDVQLTTLEGVPGVEMTEALLPTAECRGIVFHMTSTYASNPSLRQAIECCMDKDWFLLMSAGGTGRTGSSFMSPGSELFTQPSSLRVYDFNAARSFLVGSGYTDSDNDGMLEFRDGTKMVLTLVTSSRDEWAPTAATILTNDLAQVGIEVVWRKTDLPIREACTAKGDWDLCFAGWNGSADGPLTAASFYDDMQQFALWTSSSFEEDLSRLRTAWEISEARAYAARLQQTAYDECPAIVLSYGVDIQAVRSDMWTGYQDILSANGALFRSGSAAGYMQIEPITEE